MSEDEISIEGDLFEEPEGFLPERPSSHFSTYKRKIPNAEPQEITMKLVGHIYYGMPEYTQLII